MRDCWDLKRTKLVWSMSLGVALILRACGVVAEGLELAPAVQSHSTCEGPLHLLPPWGLLKQREEVE